MRTHAYEFRRENLQSDDPKHRGYDSPKVFRTDALLRIKALTGQVWEEMRLIQRLRRQLRRSEWQLESLNNSVMEKLGVSTEGDTLTANLKIGATVEVVGAHWLRGGQRGTVIATKDNGINHWLVEFPETCEGGGIDGNKLWLNEAQLKVQWAIPGTVYSN
ncbi:MAG TPA: hypothetical protein VFM35_11335 [Candidatus Binatia bacterium]|nr:hypothetical protein [Candidatus Binatia bacterium]